MLTRDAVLLTKRLSKGLFCCALLSPLLACERDSKDDEQKIEDITKGGGAGGSGQDMAAEIRLEPDVPTCKGGETQLYADLAYLAPSEKPRPALLFIHGGGWTSGSRKDFAEFIKFAADQGYVAASIQYRLTEPVFPAEIYDVKCAVRWMRSEAAKYGADPDAIAVFGASAGAHLALMLGSTATDASFEGEGGYAGVSSQVQAVVNWFGPTDLAALYQTLDAEGQAGFEKNLGGPPSASPAIYERFSPLTWLNATSAPTLTVHGDADPLVPYAQALALEERFAAVQGRHEFYTVPGGGHGFKPLETLKALERSFEFLKAVFPPEAAP